MITELGSVQRSVQGREAVLRWRVPDFSTLTDRVDSFCRSPIFECFGRRWYMDLFPNVLGADRSEGSLVLRLGLLDSQPPLPVRYHVGIQTRQGEVEGWLNGGRTFDDNDWFHDVSRIPRCEVFCRRHHRLPGDQLTIVVTLEEEAPRTDSRDVCVQTEMEDGAAGRRPEKTGTQSVCVQTEAEEGAVGCLPEEAALRKMQEDMKNLLTTGEDSDVIIKVQGKEFPAHKNVLRARFPVFKAMFDYDTVEKESGSVEIEDCDSDAFRDFLTYLYTGSARHIHGENVCSLYTSSDKYCVDELREACVSFMKNNLSVEAFCDVASLALLHSEKDLLVIVTDFFCRNFREVIKSPKWKTFLHENTKEANALLMKAVSA